MLKLKFKLHLFGIVFFLFFACTEVYDARFLEEELLLGNSNDTTSVSEDSSALRCGVARSNARRIGLEDGSYPRTARSRRRRS